MLKIYGTDQCPDCVNCKADLDKAGVAYEYLDIFQDLGLLKAFLALRDGSAAFDSVRRDGKIGIPCLVDAAGVVCLDWAEYL